MVEAFEEVVAEIKAASDDRDLRELKSLRYEKLKGKRGKRGERSLRLTDQWRLTLTVEEDEHGKYIQILEIIDYHT